MLVNFLVGILGIILFLFIFWKRLKDDYSSDIIFQVATGILAGFSIGILIAKLFFPTWFFWITLAGSLGGMFLMMAKYKLRFYESFEALILGILPFIAIMFFEDSIANSSLTSFLAFTLTLVLIFLAYWLDVNYKSFTWYKSGRVGFAGLAIAIIFFVVRTIIAIFGISVISFVGQIEIIISGGSALICSGLLINLGNRK